MPPPARLSSCFCRTVADDIAVEMDFDAEGLVVVGSALADEDIFDRLLGVALDYLLQGGLVVRDDRLLLVRLIDKTEDELLRRLYAAVEIDSGEHSFKRIGEDRRAILAAGEHFALAEDR